MTERELETTEQPAQAHSARSILVRWANGQEHWARAIASEVLATGRELNDAAIGAVFSQFLAEKGLSDTDRRDIPKLVFEPTAQAPGQPLTITRLSEVKYVNALAVGQEILFNPKMTILYGENASGKSGYVRILKKIASVRSAEQVLGNILAPSGQPPEAKIDYKLGDGNGDCTWNGDAGVDPFTALCVFDSKAVTFHLDQDLTYVYTPQDLALFRHTQQGIESIRGKLESERARRAPGASTFASRVTIGTAVHSALSSLSATTRLEDLRTLADLTPEDETNLQALNAKVEALQPQAVQAKLQVEKEKHDLLDALRCPVAAIVDFDWAEYFSAATRLAAAKHRQEEASTRAFAGSEIPGVLQEPWQKFIQAGEVYLAGIGEADYPDTSGPKCIYCRQNLDEAAVALITKYRDYCTDVHRIELDGATAHLAGILSSIAKSLPLGLEARLERAIAQRADVGEENLLLGEAASFMQRLRQTIERISRAEQFDNTALLDIAKGLLQKLTSATELAGQVTASLSKEKEQLAEDLATETKKRDDLADRFTLRKMLAEVEAFLDKTVWEVRAGQIAGRFTSILTSLTASSKEASELLLNGNFVQLFAEECDTLAAPSVALDFPGRQGQTKRRKKLRADHKLGDVLSEGEQKAIALSDFIAEARLREAPAPIVFDDPVNSLDHPRLQRVAKRIAGLAEAGQVIVFTHNIWFTAELLHCFDRTPADCSYYAVTATGHGKGVVHQGTHPKWDTVDKLTKRVNTSLDEAQRKTGEERDRQLETVYSLIRSWCETFVEQEVFAGVTKRYQPNVAMTCLEKVRPDRMDAAISAVVPIFDKACRCMDGHSQPLETLSVRPTIEEARSDWQAARDARTAYIS